VGNSSPSPTETDSEDAMFGMASSFCCCALGSFRILSVPCESPVKIFYLVLLMAKNESLSLSFWFRLLIKYSPVLSMQSWI
jgi:hypothetical protein